MSSWNTRRATIDDVATLVDCWVELVQSQMEYGTQLLAEPNRSTAERWTTELILREQIIVAEVEATIAGFVSFEPQEERFQRAIQSGIIHNLYVRESFRNRGVGSDLLAEAERALLDCGVDRVQLEILTDNAEAEAFYRSRAYEPHRLVFAKEATEIDTHNNPDEES